MPAIDRFPPRYPSVYLQGPYTWPVIEVTGSYFILALVYVFAGIVFFVMEVFNTTPFKPRSV
jgi:hypothetical protein